MKKIVSFIKMNKKMLIIILCVVALPLISYFCYKKIVRKVTNEYLISNLDKYTQCNNNPDNKVWLVSYANGKLYEANQNWLTYSSINKCVNFFLPYRLKDLDNEFVNQNSKILSEKRGAGYWLWKPYVILKALRQIPENDLVLYLDSRIIIIKPIDSFVNKLGNADIILIKGSHPIKKYVKRDLLKALDADDSTKELDMLEAGFLLVRNSPFSREFIEEWLSLCKDEKLLTDTPSQDEYPDFIDHRHDQSILTMLFLKNQKSEYRNKIISIPIDDIAKYDFKEQDLTKYFFQHRRCKFDALRRTGYMLDYVKSHD